MPPGEKGLFLQTSGKRTEVQKAEVLQKGEKISPFSETWLCKDRVLELSRAGFIRPAPWRRPVG
jgi:hypothetical protein